MGNSESRLLLTAKFNEFVTATPEEEGGYVSAILSGDFVDDVYEELQPNFVREMRVSNPLKLIYLIQRCCETIRFHFEQCHSQTKWVDKSAISSLNTSVRVLSRVVPVLHEDMRDDAFSCSFYGNQGSVSGTSSLEHSLPVYKQLSQALFEICFIPGYTNGHRKFRSAESSAPSKVATKESVDSNLVWGSMPIDDGVITSSRNLPYRQGVVSSQIVSNRIEVVRLLILALSRPLYLSLTECDDEGPGALHEWVVSDGCVGPFAFKLELLLSLLITVLEYKPHSFAVPIISTALSDDSAVSQEQELFCVCMHLLNVLVNPSSKTNFFKEKFSAILSKESVSTIGAAFRDKLVAVHSQSSLFSFSSTSRVHDIPALALFLHNIVAILSAGELMNIFCVAAGSRQVILSLLSLLVEDIKTQLTSSISVSHVVAITLLRLSAHREFVIETMNETYQGELDTALGAVVKERRLNTSPVLTLYDVYLSVALGIAGDFVRNNKNSALLPPSSPLEILLTGACNMYVNTIILCVALSACSRSPYIKQIDAEVANWLVSLQSNPATPPVLQQLLGAVIAYTLHYQYDRNGYLVYALLRQEDGLKGKPGIKRKPDEIAPISMTPFEATMDRLLVYLSPRVESFCASNEGAIDDSHVVEFIKKISLIGILPLPPAIVARQFETTKSTCMWLMGFTWGTVFSATQNFFDWKHIRLISIRRLSHFAISLSLVLASLWENLSGSVETFAVRVASLSSDPFKWHCVLQALLHPATWPGTAQGYRWLIGALLDDHRLGPVTCTTECMHCGKDSFAQKILHSIFTIIECPSSGSRKSHSSRFLGIFTKFSVDLLTLESSPFRPYFERVMNAMRLAQSAGKCPFSALPSYVELLSWMGGSEEEKLFFFHLLALHFSGELLTSASPRHTRVHSLAQLPSLGTFFLLLAARLGEASSVESGRNFDKLMLEWVKEFCMDSGDGRACSPTDIVQFKSSGSSMSVAVLTIIKNFLRVSFLPVTEWASSLGSNQLSAPHLLESLIKAGKPLPKCQHFMEPSVVLGVVWNLLKVPGTIPDLYGNSEGRFDYKITDIRILRIHMDRAICNVKSSKSGGGVVVVTDRPPTDPTAHLTLTVKEVSVDLEHNWRMDWNTKRQGSYCGSNNVHVKGLSCYVNLTLHADDRGPEIDSVKFSLGKVEHSCKFLNASFVSEMLAQAALDWFAEPLTRLLQSASQSSVESFLKEMCIDFRVSVWNKIVLDLIPPSIVRDIIKELDEKLPPQGVQF